MKKVMLFEIKWDFNEPPLSVSIVYTSAGFPLVNVALQSYLIQEMEKFLPSPLWPNDFHELLDFFS